MRQVVYELATAVGQLARRGETNLQNSQKTAKKVLQNITRESSAVGSQQRQSLRNTSSTSTPKRSFRSGLLVAASAVAALSYSRMSSDQVQCQGGWWVPSSASHLEEAERQVFDAVKADVELSFVELENGLRVRTMVVNRGKYPGVEPLVLVHGFAAAIGTWAKNIDDLSNTRTVYAMDQVGFGRSDRPEFSTDAAEAEDEFVENIEQWRVKMELNSFVLLGHSLGGFISTAYALKYPQYVKHLIVAEPWGFPPKPEEGTRWEREAPIRYRMITYLSGKMNPLSILRGVGPFGPGMFKRIRGDLQRVFSDMYPESTMMDYMYHCNVQHPSGEVAMKSLMGSIGFAAFPMADRVQDLSEKINISFLYGERSWMDSGTGDMAQEALGEDRVSIAIIPDASHHVYGFNGFNQMVDHFCRQVDANSESA